MRYWDRWFRQLLTVFLLLALATPLVWMHFSADRALAVSPPSVTEFQPNIKWGGRAVAVDVSPSNTNVAIVASESGGLFKTVDGGATWSHIDSLSPFRMSDVKYDPGNTNILIASAVGDTRPINGGGIWRSTDGGATWQKPATANPPAGPRCNSRFNTWGISFAPGTSDVVVATDCGVAVSHDLGATWTHVFPSATSSQVTAVVAQAGGAGGSIIDTCGPDGHHRSTDGGATFGMSSTALPNCTFIHGIAASPLESTVIFATRFVPPPSGCMGGASAVFEGDFASGGTITWTQIISSTCKGGGRQPWVATHRSRDNNSTHFDIYFGSGLNVYRQTCTNTGGPGTRCSTSWSTVSVDHSDQQGLAFSTAPGNNCAQYLVSDGGVHKTTDCGATWTITGSGSGGYDALQIYEVDGQVHPDHTDLYFGTQDNNLWATGDNGLTWPNNICCEGFFLQIPHNSPSDAGQTITGVACGPCSNFSAPAHFASQSGWNNPPASSGNPFLITPGVYVEWAQPSPPSSQLYITTNSGASWTAVSGATISLSLSGRPYISGPPASPTIYQAVRKPGNVVGLDKITGVRSATATVTAADSGLNSIGGYCMGAGTFVCPTVFGVDPNNPQHLIAADAGTNQMKDSTDGGASWSVDSQLTNLVTGSGQFLFNAPNAGSQAHFIAFDPTNGNRIVVGTEAAGLIASIDGGQTWTTMFGSASVIGSTSAFFDEVQNDVIVSTYGRGLWKLSFAQRASTLNYVGDMTADYHDPATLAAVLTDQSTGTPIVGAILKLSLGPLQTCMAVTDKTGRGACIILPNEAAGPYAVAASFAGDAQYTASSDTKTFIVTREETTLTYTGDTLIANGTTAHLSAVLLEDGATAITGRPVTFTLGSGASAQMCSSTTAPTGLASCSISPVAQPLGPGTVSADFAGDSFYLPSSAQKNTLLFAFLDHGSFVVGDQSAGLYLSVTFWSARWSKLNSLSGGPAPADFKGFASALSTTPPTCGGSWSADPGNSSKPPGQLPSYVAVIVASSASRSGNEIRGNILEIVIVKTNSSYAPNPGHAGTGIVVAVYCRS
jgi:hypothetical protein